MVDLLKTDLYPQVFYFTSCLVCSQQKYIFRLHYYKMASAEVLHGWVTNHVLWLIFVFEWLLPLDFNLCKLTTISFESVFSFFLLLLLLNVCKKIIMLL